MTRFMLLVICVLTCALFAVPASADDPPKKLTAEERKALEAKRDELFALGTKAYQAERYADAIKPIEEAVQVARQIYNTADFPNGHTELATYLNNLALLYTSVGRYADAELLYDDSLGMYRRLFKRDHPTLATSLINLGDLYKAQGKYADAEPLYKESLEIRRRLFKGDHPGVALSLNNLAIVYKHQRKYAEAGRLYKDALEMHKRLYKGDHSNTVTSLNNLADLYYAQGQYTDAEPLYKESLEMTRRLFKGDHPDVATGLSKLALLYGSQGKHADAEPLYKESLEIHRRLFKGDHPSVAQSLNGLAYLYHAQERYADAEPLYKDALAMHKRLLKGDHPSVATSLNNLAGLYYSQGKYAEAEPLFKDALEMTRRLLKGDHPDVATGLNNLGLLYRSQGKYEDAEPLYKDALAMNKRLFKDKDHPELAVSLINLGDLYRSQKKYTAAEPLFKAALEMNRRLTARFARDKTEGETLTFFASQPRARDPFLSNELVRAANPTSVYQQVWAEKGSVARAFERRQLQARAATADPVTATMFAELADTRRRRAELLLAPAAKDPATREKRNDAIKGYETRIESLTRDLKELLPSLERADQLAAALPSDLQKVLPADAAVVDFLRFSHLEQDEEVPGRKGRTYTTRYMAFVITRASIVWVDLDTDVKIEPAVHAWREAVTSAKEIPAAVPAKVRELVWDKVRKQLPSHIKTVYVSPDATLCKLPFAALPGDKPGTVLLEDFALATVPHAPFLLDKLGPQDPVKNPPAGVLVVGGVKYDADPALPAPGGVGGEKSPTSPLLKPGAKLGWSFLPGTAAEATGVLGAATAKKLPTTTLAEDKATAAAVLAALPRAKYAHFATHGFFADSSFRSVFQLDPKDYEQRGSERVGRAANSPLVMTGLVFAGANNEKTPDRGIITGESLIDLDLSGLELAVLSACETGLGDVAGGEGTFGLQRAFHLAGTRDVVASLWKVPDQSTAALMALFYRNLWDKNLSPVEALRQAQLAIYRDPAKIPELAKGFRGKFEEVPGMGDADIKPAKDGKAHPLLWAAFTLSGPGR